MPSPQIVTADQVPDHRPPTRRKDPELQHIIDVVTDSLPLIRDLEPGSGQALMFHFTAEDHPNIEVTGAVESSLKDRYRRMFRKALKDVGLTSDDITVTYDFDLRRLPSTEVLGMGFRAFVEPAEEE